MLHRCGVWPAIDRLGVGWLGGRTMGIVDQAQKEITYPCDLLFSIFLDFFFLMKVSPAAYCSAQSNRSA